MAEILAAVSVEIADVKDAVSRAQKAELSKQEIVPSFLQLNDRRLLLLGEFDLVTAITINLIPKLLEKTLLGEVFKRIPRGKGFKSFL